MIDIQEFIEKSFKESSEVKINTLNSCKDEIIKSIEKISEKLQNRGKVLFIGNGGSAADCQHLATEFMIRLNHSINRPAIAALALTTDSSNLTAGGNDIGFENVFARNIEGLGKNNDVLIAISTSGNSKNIILAIEKAKSMGILTIGLTGQTGGKMNDICDIIIRVPSNNVQRIQEAHITIGHIIVESVELKLYS